MYLMPGCCLLIRLRKLKKKIDLIGTRTRDFPASKIVPQPTTLPRAPILISVVENMSLI
jgi:hypothetical protein